MTSFIELPPSKTGFHSETLAKVLFIPAYLLAPAVMLFSSEVSSAVCPAPFPCRQTKVIRVGTDEEEFGPGARLAFCFPLALRDVRGLREVQPAAPHTPRCLGGSASTYVTSKVIGLLGTLVSRGDHGREAALSPGVITSFRVNLIGNQKL